jgi:hypothetical protein
VRVFVEGDGIEFEYGYDFYECGTQKLYHRQGADEFLPFYGYLDFVTSRTPGWSSSRTMTWQKDVGSATSGSRKEGKGRKDSRRFFSNRKEVKARMAFIAVHLIAPCVDRPVLGNDR